MRILIILTLAFNTCTPRLIALSAPMDLVNWSILAEVFAGAWRTSSSLWLWSSSFPFVTLSLGSSLMLSSSVLKLCNMLSCPPTLNTEFQVKPISLNLSMLLKQHWNTEEWLDIRHPDIWSLAYVSMTWHKVMQTAVIYKTIFQPKLLRLQHCFIYLYWKFNFSDFVNLNRKLITRIESGFRISADCLKIFFCFVAVIYNSTEDKFMVSVYHSLTTWHLIFYLWELMMSTETWVFSYQFMARINIKYPYIHVYLRPIVMSHHAS